MKSFHTKVKCYDPSTDSYLIKYYMSKGESKEEAIEYAKVMFLSEHKNCNEKNLTVSFYSIVDLNRRVWKFS